jgi:ADP-ribose pyrophosphatase
MPPKEKNMTKTKKANPLPAAKILSRKTVFKSYHKLDVVSVKPRSLKDPAKWIPEMQREIFFGKTIAIILLYIPETDEVLLNQQFRLGAMLAGEKHPHMLECAAGAVDPGEKPAAAAKRETYEETGCKIIGLEFVGNCYSSPGCMAEQFYMYVGRIKKAKSGIYGHAHEGEEILTHLLPWKKVLSMIDKGEITNVNAALMLNWFARHRDRLRRKWLRK